MNRHFDDDQLERFVRHLARLHLEIERGVRDPDQLAQHLPPPVRTAWQRSRPAGTPLPGGAAREDELGAVHLGYGANGRVFANITTPTQPDRRGALTFVLDTRQDGITIRQVQRVHARGNYGIGSTVKTAPPPDTPIDEQLRRARTDRDQAGAALRSADQQKRDSDGGHATDGTTQSRDNWRKIVTNLDREIRTLGQRRQAHDQIDPPGRSR
jgi:hypothetical protein